MSTATYLMTFGADKWIMRNIQNAWPYVDKIYVLHSMLPFAYNSAARTAYVNTFDLNTIRESPYMAKVTIIEGDWPTEEEARNACVERARQDNITYLMIHDPDEFYTNEDFSKIIWILNNDIQYSYYEIFTRTFWKSFKNVIVMPTLNHAPTMKNTELKSKIINLNLSDRGSALLNDIICYHGSYVLTDAEVYQKIKTWRNYADFDTDNWYNEVWLPWTLESRNLHPVKPEHWSNCEIYEGPLPEVISDLG
jgi:hypothetical protein